MRQKGDLVVVTRASNRSDAIKYLWFELRCFRIAKIYRMKFCWHEASLSTKRLLGDEPPMARSFTWVTHPGYLFHRLKPFASQDARFRSNLDGYLWVQIESISDHACASSSFTYSVGKSHHRMLDSSIVQPNSEYFSAKQADGFSANTEDRARKDGNQAEKYKHAGYFPSAKFLPWG